jgi:hypothetical protein
VAEGVDGLAGAGVAAGAAVDADVEPIAAVAPFSVATELNWITGEPVTVLPSGRVATFTPSRAGTAEDSQTF